LRLYYPLPDSLVTGDEVSVHKIVKKYGTLAGIGDLAAHDLRRTFAQTVYAASGHDIVLVSRLLGHASVKTTERYLSLSTTDATEAVNAMTWGMAAD
jgi:integrase